MAFCSLRRFAYVNFNAFDRLLFSWVFSFGCWAFFTLFVFSQQEGRYRRSIYHLNPRRACLPICRWFTSSRFIRVTPTILFSLFFKSKSKIRRRTWCPEAISFGVQNCSERQSSSNASSLLHPSSIVVPTTILLWSHTSNYVHYFPYDGNRFMKTIYFFH